MTDLEMPREFDAVPADAVYAILHAWSYEMSVLQAELDAIAEEVRSLEQDEPGEHAPLPQDQRDEIERRLIALLDDWLQREEQDLPTAIEAARGRAEDRVRLAKVEAGAIRAATRAVMATEGPEAAPTSPRAQLAASPIPPAALTHAPAEAPAAGTSEVDDVLTALLAALDDPQPLAPPLGAPLAPASGHGPSADDTPSPLLPPAGLQAQPAEADAEHRRFWEGEAAAMEKRTRRQRWVLTDLVLPLVALVLVLVVALLVIG